MDSYIVINGKKTELTEEQLKQLGIEIKKETPFERKEGKVYYAITEDGTVMGFKEDGSNCDEKFHKIANYCRNKDIIYQRALHEILNRLLWRLACENGELENEWNGVNYHFEVFFDENEQEFKTQYKMATHTFGPFFPTKDVAEKAIGIIRRFMEEHPGFIW